MGVEGGEGIENKSKKEQELTDNSVVTRGVREVGGSGRGCGG